MDTHAGKTPMDTHTYMYIYYIHIYIYIIYNIYVYIFYFSKCVCMCTQVHSLVTHGSVGGILCVYECLDPWKPEKGVRSLSTGIIGSYKLPNMVVSHLKCMLGNELWPL